MSTISIRDRHALRLIKESWSAYEGIPPPIFPPDDSAPEPETTEDIAKLLSQFGEAFDLLNIGPNFVLPKHMPYKIGIIGAGVAGLYAAMILESLDLGFEILEGSDRIGGRLLTHKLGPRENEYYVSSRILQIVLRIIFYFLSRMSERCASQIIT